MSTTRCFCGHEESGRDDDALTVTMQQHLMGTHDLEVSAVMTRNAIERARQLGPVPDPVTAIAPITTTPLSPTDADGYAAFFDRDAFTDNVGWASCYCMFHHLDPAVWDQRTWQQNRSEMLTRIRSGTTTGVLARVGEDIVGWVNAGPRSAYPAHRSGDAADDTTGAIVCFVVAPAHRGHGVGRRLLEAAVAMLRETGMTAVEAYPVEAASSAAAAYHGTVAMYLDAGFTLAGDGVVQRLL